MNQSPTTFLCIVFANLDFNLVETRVEVVESKTAIVLSHVHPFGILTIAFDPQLQLS